MTEVWGLLEKSQTDPQTIDEAIDAKIADHEADANAHLGTGESLEAHKTSEVIDHLADSIVSDKIEGDAVLPEHVDGSLFYIAAVTLLGDETATGDFVFADVTDLRFDFSASRSCKAMISVNLFASTSGNDANPVVRIKVNNDSGVSYYPGTSGWPMIGNLIDAQTNFLEDHFSAVVDLYVGQNIITLQLARSTPDETVKLLAGSGNGDCDMSIVSLGAVITPTPE